MKRFFATFTLAAALVCSNVMAQQPEHHHHHPASQQEKVDQARPDQAPQTCQQHCQNGEAACAHQCKQGEANGQPQCQKCDKKCQHGDKDCKGHCQQGCQHHQGHADAFRPHGKPIVMLFEHLGATSTSDGWTQNGFQMERAYLGYKYMFDPHWTATVILDATEAGNGGTIEHVFLKNANVQYKNHGLTAIAGVIPTAQGTMAEKYWGLRYVARSMYDLYGYGNVADLGFNIKYDFAPWFSADVSMLNGEGFRKIQLDNHYLYALGLTFQPFEHFDVRVYGDIQTHDTTLISVHRTDLSDTTVNMAARKNLHVFAGYNHRYFRVGAEYNWQFACDNIKGDNASGLSVYAIGKVTPKLNLFCRYDRGVSQDNELLGSAYSYSRDGQNLFAGIDYHVNKLVAVSPAIQYHITPDNQSSLYAYLSCKIDL